jgi:integrase
LRLVRTHLGDIAVRQLRPEQVAAFLSRLIDAGSAARARNVRTLLVQVLDEAVNLGLAEENVAKRVRPPSVPKVQRRTLTPAEVAQLRDVCDGRFEAAVALCFVQGWRISEALGLAWQDVDVDAGTVRLRRGATYADGIGMMLGPTKTPSTAGRQLLGPAVGRLWRAVGTACNYGVAALGRDQLYVGLQLRGNRGDAAGRRRRGPVAQCSGSVTAIA